MPESSFENLQNTGIACGFLMVLKKSFRICSFIPTAHLVILTVSLSGLVEKSRKSHSDSL